MNCATEGCTRPRHGNSKYCPEHKQEAHRKWLEVVRASSAAREERVQSFEALYQKAHEAGHQAATACQPVPMVVQEHANMADDSSPVVKQYYVPSGACGFAWVVVNPGNCSFALWLKKNKGARKHYYGGMSLWVSDYGQSVDRKVAYAGAFAAVLQGAGIKAHPGNRLD